MESCPGGELSWWEIGELSWWGIVLVGSHPDGSCPGRRCPVGSCPRTDFLVMVAVSVNINDYIISLNKMLADLHKMISAYRTV